MYLRVTERRNRDGSSVAYYALAENVWNAQTKRSEAQVIHNFGRADQFDKAALQRLIASIQRIIDADAAVPSPPAARPASPTSRSTPSSNLASCWPPALCGRISASAKPSATASPKAN
jgi:hypothetical protein